MKIFSSHKVMGGGLCSLIIYGELFALLAADYLLRFHNISQINLGGWIGSFYVFFPWTLFAMIPLWMLGKYARFVYLPIGLCWIVIESVEWMVRIKYDMILDGDWVGILLGSSTKELTDYLRQMLCFTSVAVISIVALVSYVFVRIISLSRNVVVTRNTVFMAFLAACAFIYANSMINSRLKCFEKLDAVNMIVDSIRSYDSYVKIVEMAKHPRLPETSYLREEVDDLLCVYVLGESVVRRRMGLYGYGRDTTPNMCRLSGELIRFDNLVACAKTTDEAMRYIFTTRKIESNDDMRYTMAQALRQVGYSCTYISNQDRWGWGGDGGESFYFSGCDSMYFMKEMKETNRLDEVVLKYLKSELDKCVQKQTLFVHMAGSHFPVDSSYPRELAPFAPESFRTPLEAYYPERSQNHYDNSIWYTDIVLNSIIEMLKATGRPCCMIFLSDHGESPSSKNWRLATDRDIWDVPMFIWVSDTFRTKYSGALSRLETARTLALQSDQLFYGLLDFLGVEGLALDPYENFLDERFASRKPRKILRGQAVYHWDMD